MSELQLHDMMLLGERSKLCASTIPKHVDVFSFDGKMFQMPAGPVSESSNHSNATLNINRPEGSRFPRAKKWSSQAQLSHHHVIGFSNSPLSAHEQLRVLGPVEAHRNPRGESAGKPKPGVLSMKTSPATGCGTTQRFGKAP